MCRETPGGGEGRRISEGFSCPASPPEKTFPLPNFQHGAAGRLSVTPGDSRTVPPIEGNSQLGLARLTVIQGKDQFSGMVARGGGVEYGQTVRWVSLQAGRRRSRGAQSQPLGSGPAVLEQSEQQNSHKGELEGREAARRSREQRIPRYQTQGKGTSRMSKGNSLRFGGTARDQGHP